MVKAALMCVGGITSKMAEVMAANKRVICYAAVSYTHLDVYKRQDVRQYACEGQYERCEEIITEAMEKFPHAAQPHNLLGIRCV